jgi:1L-myo-inositol 1-phosphate cytidylyltransferase / CDP-L-myo-inositol myo-inositolphosphotransferase
VTRDVAFLEVGAAQGHRMILGGVSALERAIRQQARQGARRVIVAAEPVPLRAGLPAEVEFVPPGTAPPAGAALGRADVIAGIEVIDEASRRAAEWALIRHMNKSFEGPVDAAINWRVSMRITRVLARTRVTPNQVTIVAIGVGLGAALLALGGPWRDAALGGVLLQLNSILDSCDGELARLRFQYSRLGQWLDNLGDDLVDNLFLAAVGLGLGGIWAWIGAGAAAGRLLVAATTYVSVYRRTGTGDVFAFRWWFESDKRSADDVYDLRSPLTWLRSLGRRDTYVFAWMLACLAAFPQWVVGHGAAIAAVNLTLLVLQLTVYRPRAPR